LLRSGRYEPGGWYGDLGIGYSGGAGLGWIWEGKPSSLIGFLGKGCLLTTMHQSSRPSVPMKRREIKSSRAEVDTKVMTRLQAWGLFGQEVVRPWIHRSANLLIREHVANSGPVSLALKLVLLRRIGLGMVCLGMVSSNRVPGHIPVSRTSISNGGRRAKGGLGLALLAPSTVY
jgi:hypothetical protein